MTSKFTNLLINTVLPFSILILCLFQLYFQYSSFVTPRNELFNEKDKRDTFISYNLYNKKFGFNLEKIKETFSDNALMRINIVKNYTLKVFDKINEKREEYIDKKKYMLFYLICYDFIFIIFIYIFIFGGFKSGIVKIIFQVFKIYSTAKRLKMSNPDIYLYEAVFNYFKNVWLRDWTLFTPEGFQIFEFLFNFVIILDIIWLIILLKRRYKKKKDNIKYIKHDSTDDREDYKNKIIDNNNENNEDKIYSNENNDSDKNISEENNNNINQIDNNDNNIDININNDNIANIDNDNIRENIISNKNIFNDFSNEEVSKSLNNEVKEDNIDIEKPEGNEEEMEDKKEISEEEIDEQETK